MEFRYSGLSIRDFQQQLERFSATLASTRSLSMEDSASVEALVEDLESSPAGGEQNWVDDF